MVDDDILSLGVICDSFWLITQKLSQIGPYCLFKSCLSCHDLSFEPTFIYVLQNYFFHRASPAGRPAGKFGGPGGKDPGVEI